MHIWRVVDGMIVALGVPGRLGPARATAQLIASSTQSHPTPVEAVVRHEARIDLGLDPATGKRRQASKQGFRTKREADLAMQEIVKSHLDGGIPTLRRVVSPNRAPIGRSEVYSR